MEATNIDFKVREAVKLFWTSRNSQFQKQVAGRSPDQGFRAAVTGGKHMVGFSQLISDVLVGVGIDSAHVFYHKAVELPGYYRGTKQWDLVVVQQNTLIAVVEAKSHIGPSFGNNINNRVEEAVGSATDIWTAYREGKFGILLQPWLGYLILVEDCEKSRNPVTVKEPHFEVFPEFKGASYIKRYEIFCTRLIRERLYSHAALITSSRDEGIQGNYREPVSELSLNQFVLSLANHAKSSLERLRVD